MHAKPIYSITLIGRGFWMAQPIDLRNSCAGHTYYYLRIYVGSIVSSVPGSRFGSSSARDQIQVLAGHPREICISSGWGLGTEGRCKSGIQCLPEIEQRQLKLIGWRRLYYLLLLTILIDTPVCIHKYMRTQSRHSTSHQKRRTWEYKCGGHQCQ